MKCRFVIELKRSKEFYRLITLVESSKLCAILPRPQAACYILEIESIRKKKFELVIHEK